MLTEGQFVIQVKGEEPINAPPALFSNFLAISRVATDVQLEFVFLDLNQLALILQSRKGEGGEAPMPLVAGQTVAKIIMPAAAFVQLREHLLRVMADIQKDMAQFKETQDASTSERRATGA